MSLKIKHYRRKVGQRANKLFTKTKINLNITKGASRLGWGDTPVFGCKRRHRIISIRIKGLQLWIIEVDLDRRVIVIVHQLTTFHSVEWIDPHEIKRHPGIEKLHLLKATGKGHVPASGDHATLLPDLSLQLVRGDLQSRLISLQLIKNAR
jgi:hypothetical protein